MLQQTITTAPQFISTATGFSFTPFIFGAVLLAVIYTAVVIIIKKGSRTRPYDGDAVSIAVCLTVVTLVGCAMVGWWAGTGDKEAELAAWIQEAHPDIRVSAHADLLLVGAPAQSPDTHKLYRLYEVAPDVFELMEASE